MKTIRPYILTTTLLLGLSLSAQDRSTKKADKLYDRLQFVDAAEEYKELVDEGEGNAYVYGRLADSYYNMFNTEEAERWYARALESGDDPEMVYRYAEMLKANGKYEASNAQMDRFATMRPSDDRAVAYRENPDYLPKILEKGKKFNVQNLGFNTQYSDFGGTFHDGRLYVTSARNTSRRTYGWNEEPFLDIYAMARNEDGTYQPAELLEDGINTKYHEGIVSFSPDGGVMYFSRESFFEKMYEKDSITKNRYGVLQLFRANRLGDGWGDAEGFSLNSENYSVKNPSVSSDGKTLYFASDMPGGFGKFDIYRASINEDGTLGDPENLGQKVNTEGQEMFPYISSEDILYFSSNGHLGLGGLDVFHTKAVDGRFGPVRNVGIPVNGNADDFAFRLDEASGEGFVSSNREGGKGSDDVYAIKKLQPLCDVLLTTTVTDSDTGAPINAATVSLYDAQGNKVLTKVSDSDGTVEFIVECGDDGALEVVADGYESGREEFDGTEEEELGVGVALDPIEEIVVADKVVLEPIYFDFDRHNITSRAAFELDKLVELMQKYPDMVVEVASHTDNRGSDAYNQGLSERRAESTVQYVVSKGVERNRISGVGKGEGSPAVDCGGNCTEEQHQNNRRSEFTITSGGPNAG